jgi:hypothetical protein
MTIQPKVRIYMFALSLVHASVVSALWYALFAWDKDLVKVGVWVALAAVWPVWIVALALPGKDRARVWFAAMALGLAILFPTFDTLYSFGSWSIWGFAP